MPEPILDAVALRVMAFAHPRGIDFALRALAVTRARTPAEVYDRDEARRPLALPDEDLSEFARGLRFAARRAAARTQPDAERFQTWLHNARQLAAHFERSELAIEYLDISELQQRLALEAQFGVGRGEAACLVLARRYGADVVFLSSDAHACRVAANLGVSQLTLVDVLKRWIVSAQPNPEFVDDLVNGMRAAKFALSRTVLQELDQLHRGREAARSDASASIESPDLDWDPRT